MVVLGIYYYKLQTFLYLPANGIVQGMRPIIGYNYGAGEDARVKRIYDLTLAMTGTIMAGGTVLCLVFAGPLMNVFSSNPETIAAGQPALRDHLRGLYRIFPYRDRLRRTGGSG